MSTTSSLLEDLQWRATDNFWITSDGIEVHPEQLLKLTTALVKESGAVHEAIWSVEGFVSSRSVKDFRKALAAFERYFERQARKAGL